MPNPERHLVIGIEDRASATLRGLVDIVPKGREIEIPPLPMDLIHVTASPQPDGSLVIVQLPSIAVLKWAARVAADCYPTHLRSVKVALPE